MNQKANSSRLRVTLGLIVVVLSGLVAVSLTQGPTAHAASLLPADQRKAMPSFSMKDLDGKTWSLDEQKGKVVLVNFWATWCPPCRRETPDLVKIANEYSPKGLSTVGIALDEGDGTVIKNFAKDQKIPYPVVRPEDNSPVTKDITAIPVTLLLDRQARVAKKYVGAVSHDDLSKEIEALLAEK